MAVSYKDINELDKRQVLSGEEKIPVSDMEYMDVAQIAKYVEAQSGKKYASLERLGPFLFKITFDSLPEDNGGETPISGGCSSYVQDGKLYRNLDFNYDKVAEFKVIAKEFEGMSFIPGLNDGDLDEDLFAQLPYRVNDGVNRQGIKVSTHVLFNDWEWTGTGDKSIPLTRLPFLILSKVKSMATIADDLSGILNNVTSTEGLDAMGYLIQFLVTDGITSYAILPPTSEGEPYVLQNITSNPKLANFRWVNSQTVTRDQLQTRPTGVERFNLMPCPLSELRFTKAYEAPTRLSEFIGIDDTTKDSTDEELEAIYNRAHALYLDRERDGQTWQTLHSVVYGDKIESLHVQENYIDNYAEVTKDYVDEEIARVEAEIPAKVSDLENDSEFQTGTEVDIKVAAEKTRAEAAESALDASKVDKVVGKGLSSNDYTTTEKQKLAGLENYDDTSITGRATALEGQVNKVVLNGMTASEDGSTVKLSLAKINIKTGATSSVDVPLPVVDANGAGILNPQTYQTIISNQTLINAIIGASVAVSGLAAEPTQAQVTNAWLTASGLEELVNGARLFDVTNTKVWTYYTNTELWYPVEAEGGGSVVIAQWTNSALGTVKGVADNAGHTNDGKLTAETDGTGSVLGWDRLIARVQTIESKEADWDGKQDALSEDQLAAVNSGITAPKLTALEQKVGDREATETSMGYVLLDPSKTFSEQVTAEDTIYEIRDNFDLDDDEVEIPTNCVLKFNGGKVSNGILDLNNCFIDSKTLCFNAVLPSDNSLFSQEVNPCWFGAIGDGANDDTDAWLSTIAFAKKINTRGETFRNFGKSQIRIRAEKNQYFRLTSPLLVEGNISIVGGFTFYYDNTGAEYEGAIAFKGNIYNQEYSFSVKNIYQSDTTLYDYDQQGAKFVGIALGSPTNSIGMGLCNFHDIAIIGFHTAISLYGNGGFVYQCIFDQIISTYAIKMFDIISYNRAWHNSNTFRNITMFTPSGGYKMPNGVNEAVCFNFYGDGTYVPNSLLFENVHLEGHPLNNSLYKTVPIKEAASALGITRISLWILRNFRCENLNNSHIIISEHSIRLNEGIIFDSAFLGTTNPSFNIAGAIISGGNTKKWGIHVSTDSGNFPSMDISFNDIVSKNKINGTYYFLDNRFPSIDIYGSFAGKTKVTSLGDFSANYAIVLAIKPGQWLSFSRNSTAATMFHLFDSDMQNVLWSDNANIHYNESVFIRAYASTEYVTPQSSGVLNNYNFCNNSNAVYYIAMTLKGDVRVDSNAALEFAEYTPIKTIGTTEDRPLLTQVGPYYEFFDTTLGKRIMVNTSNNAWVNLDGTPLDTSSV